VVRKEMIKGKETDIVDPFAKEKIEEDAFNYDIEDIEFDDTLCVLTTGKENYHQILT